MHLTILLSKYLNYTSYVHTYYAKLKCGFDMNRGMATLGVR